jgi:hypothetical protein
MAEAESKQVTLEIHPPSSKRPAVTITGAVDRLHQDPKLIHELLDLLDMPKGTEVKVLTTASSSIVR